LATAGVVLAAGVCDNNVNITAQADIDNLASCTVLSKDVTINAAGPLTEIVLDKITNILGGLSITGDNITSISMGSLAVIGGVFSMNTLGLVGNVIMPDLINVGGINFGPIGPSLQELGFTKGITTVNGDVEITDTYLQSLAGINLMTVGKFDINNNRYLTQISQQLKNATNINIQANAAGLTVAFPNLSWVTDAGFQQCGNVSVPVLQHVNGSFNCVNNTFTSFEAPKLTAVDKSISFVSSEGLTSLSLPVLATIGGGLTVANNTGLLTIDSFPVLKSVDGSIQLIGDFTNASLPLINDVRGSLEVDTTADFDCGPINALNNNQVKGQTTCNAKDGSANNNAGSPSGTTSGGSSSSPSSKPKSAGVQSATVSKVGALVVAAAFGFLAL